MTDDPPDNLLHLHGLTSPDGKGTRRAITRTPVETDPMPAPRVSFGLTGATIAQMLLDGVEWVVDHVEQREEGGRLTITLSGPLRALGGTRTAKRAGVAARMAAELTRRLRGPG